MKFLHVFLSVILLCSIHLLKAQIGIGTTTPNGSAVLDVNSNSKGFLPPRMSKTERNAIASPVAGLIIWCSNCGDHGQVQVYDGFGWTNMLGGVPAGLATGDFYGGGKVAYILQQGDPGYIADEIHGIIATPTHQSTGANWGCIDIIIGTSAAFGTGQANTTAIITAGCASPGTAARICDDLVLNGYSDWYLPSKDELYKLWLNQAATGGWVSDNYWTSTEGNNLNAHTQELGSGYQGFNFRGYPSYVRAVRSF